MPKEHKKRGRRDEKKRKRQEQTDTPKSKRQKANDDMNDDQGLQVDQPHEGPFDEEPYTPFETSVGGGEFYGLLDEEEQAYFKRADNILELNQFAAPEERRLFLESVWNEARGKELKLANSQSCSRLMEKLIQLSTGSQLKNLFQKFNGHFLSLVQHRFASHCCEALFICSAPVVTEELRTGSGSITAGGNENASMEQHFLEVVNELQESMGFLMTDRFASHAVRTLLAVLSGRPLADTSTQSLLNAKSKERIGAVHPGLIESDRTVIRAVPDTFKRSLDSLVFKMAGGLDASYLRALATQPLGNPVLQLLLVIEFSASGKQKAKDERSLFRKLLPEIPPEEGTVSATFIRGLLYDPVGSHLLETIVTYSPGKTFKSIYHGQFRGNLKSISRNDSASYVLIKALERLSADDLQDFWQEIRPEIPSLVEHSRVSVLRTLIERYHVRQISDHEIAQEIGSCYGTPSDISFRNMIKLDSEDIEDISAQRRAQVSLKDTEKSHTSLLLQKMLEYPGSSREIVNQAILAARSESLMKAALGRFSSYVIQRSFQCRDQSQSFRRSLMHKFIGRASELATNPVSSHVLDSIWAATADLMFLRERYAQELSQNEGLLRESFQGRVVWRVWLLDLFKNKRQSWIEKSREHDRQALENKASRTTDGILTKKRDIDIARERFAARKPTTAKINAKQGHSLRTQKLSCGDLDFKSKSTIGPIGSGGT